MPRPLKFRRVGFRPGVNYFKPAGMPMGQIEEVVLTMGEFEAIRLKDVEDMDQEDAAKKMDVSQPTFNRILASARKKVADAIVNGKSIRIEGGSYKFVGPNRRGFGRGRARGTMR